MSLADLTITANTSLRDVARAALFNGVGEVAVLDEHLRFLGVASLYSVAEAMKIHPGCTPIHEVRQALSDRDFASSISVVVGDDGLVSDVTMSQNPRIPVFEPILGESERALVNEALDSGWISSRGRFVEEFERQLEKFTGARCAISVCNGTAALTLAMKGLGIGSGDEVIVPDLTFAASASAVTHTGAEPVLTSVSNKCWTLDPDAVSAAISPRTKAIMPVHLFGLSADMTAINEIARKHELWVIEDAAEALGASWNGKPVGGIGTAGCFSFYANKTITTGEGGAIVTNDPDLARKYRILRDHGMSPERRYWHEVPGFNYRLTNLQAAVGVAQMKKIDVILEKKKRIFEAYVRAFRGQKNLRSQSILSRANNGMWAFCLAIAKGREVVENFLLKQNIETRHCFTALHQMPAFSKFRNVGDVSIGRELGNIGLMLPSGSTLTIEDQSRVIDGVLYAAESIESYSSLVDSWGS